MTVQQLSPSSDPRLVAPPPPPWRPAAEPCWPDPQPAERHPRLLLAGLGVGALTTLLWTPETQLGLATTIVALAGAGVGTAALGRRRRSEDLPVFALVVLLFAAALVSSADWAVVLCALAAGGVLLVTLTGARSVSGMAFAAVLASFAWVRGAGWLQRSLPRSRGPAVAWWPLLRTLGLSLALVGVFGALFAGADAVFASWTTGLLAGVDPGGLPVRLVVGGLVTALVLTGVVLAVLPPDVERFARRPRPAVRRWEWLGPVAAVAGVFLVFLLAQARGLFGGPAYLQGMGLSYAAWVHQGFGQLVAATAVVLVVVGVAARRAARRTVADRRWRQGALGGLCLLALVVAGSALHRLHLYDQAYGATRLRLLVGAFEGWMVIVLVLAGTVCVRLRGRWVPRVALLLGAAILAGLTLAGPDRLVAEHNVTRFEVSGQVDWSYLADLSSEAVPTLDRLPEPYRSCALHRLADELDRPHRSLDWTAADTRARRLLAARPLLTTSCDAVPSR